MALTIGVDSIPEIGEQVTKVVISSDGEVAWIYFGEDKFVVSHIFSTEREKVLEKFPQFIETK